MFCLALAEFTHLEMSLDFCLNTAKLLLEHGRYERISKWTKHNVWRFWMFITKEHLLYNDALFQIKAHGGKMKGFEKEPVFYSKEILIMAATEQGMK